MMKRYNSIAAALAAVAFCAAGASAQQLEIKVMSPGDLATYFINQPEAQPSTVQELKLTGHLNVVDFDYINTQLTALRTLDLSEAQIKAVEVFRPITCQEHFADDALPSLALAGMPSLESVALPSGLKSIGAGAFAGSGLKSMAIPSGVTEVGDGAYAGCTSLTTATVPATVAKLGTRAFEGCTSLTSAVVATPDVPAGAFRGCTQLATFTPGAYVATVGDDAFAGCSALTTANLKSYVRSIGAGAFRATGLTALDLSGCSQLAEVGAWAFADCPQLASVKLPAGLTALPDGAFFNCALVGTLDGLDGLEHIGAGSLKGLALIEELQPGDDVAEIGAYAFHGMSGMTQTVLPGELQHIGDYAFEGCTALRNLDATALYQVPTLGTEVWHGLTRGDISLLVPEDMKEAFKAAPVWQDFFMASSDSGVIETLPSLEQSLSAKLVRGFVVAHATAGVAEVTVHDALGMALAAERPADKPETLLIDASQMGARVLIVTVTDAEGSRVAVKLANQ